MENTVYTRKQYLNDSSTEEVKGTAFRKYYGGILDSCNFVPAKDLVQSCRHSTYPHYNDIPLSRFDIGWTANGVKKAMEDRGDYLTLAGAVCLCKEAIRRILESENTTI